MSTDQEIQALRDRMNAEILAELTKPGEPGELARLSMPVMRLNPAPIGYLPEIGRGEFYTTTTNFEVWTTINHA